MERQSDAVNVVHLFFLWALSHIFIAFDRHSITSTLVVRGKFFILFLFLFLPFLSVVDNQVMNHRRVSCARGKDASPCCHVNL